MRFLNYTIQQNDTLEGISERYLGDASAYTRLAALNQLRYPFISSDPADQLGSSPSLDTTLTQDFAGGFRLYLADSTVAAFQEGAFVLLKGTGGQIGSPIFDIAQVFGFGLLINGVMTWSQAMLGDFSQTVLASFGTGNILYLQGQPQHTYAVGAAVHLYPPPTQTRTQVLAPGAILRIPLDTDTTNVQTIAGSAYASLLGMDIALTREGFLSLTDREINLVSGTRNLEQALRTRLLTEVGELVRHPTYGDKLLTYVGSVISSVTALAFAAVTQCLLSDPRVRRVSDVRITAQGDTLSIGVSVMVADFATLITLTDIIIRTGGLAA